MVNAYMMMRRYCEMNDFTVPYSHHDFREAIAHALLDPSTWPARNRKSASPSPPTNNTKKRKPPSSASPPSKRAPKFNCNTLCPDEGKLKNRLNKSLDHMPVLSRGSKDQTCQLHMWASKEKNGGKGKKTPTPKGARQSLMHCRECVVNLCLRCWSVYHEVGDLTPKINTILSFK